MPMDPQELEQLQAVMASMTSPMAASIKLQGLSEMAVAANAIDEMAVRAAQVANANLGGPSDGELMARVDRLCNLRDRLISHCIFIDSQIKTGTETKTP